MVLTSIRRGHLAVAQSRLPTARHSFEGDVLLLVSSWERRCLEIISASLGRFEIAAVVEFEEVGSTGARDFHDRRLRDFAQESAGQQAAFERVAAGNVTRWRDQLLEFVVQARRSIGRPIDLVIDVTCLPKYYVLLLLGFSLKSGVVRSLRLFYAEGQYAALDTSTAGGGDPAFTSGRWSSYPVPYLEGALNPDRKMRIIASIGFETLQSREFIGSYDAERHLLLKPSPSFTEEYERRSEAEAQALAHYLDLQPEEIIPVPAGGVAETADAVLKILDETKRYNDVGLCLGTKPHAIALGVAAQLRPQFTLVCRIPAAYVEADTPASGTSWLYAIRDLSDTTSADELLGKGTAALEPA